ncbi:MAG: AMP-binding protein [Planctomycetaceae bacterium]|nr:AMP-binding protein [Planctomycetaceae bacterium]
MSEQSDRRSPDFSPDSSTAEPPVKGLTIGQLLRRSAAEFAGCDALVFPRLAADGSPYSGEGTPDPSADCYRLTWSQFDAETDRIARGLLAAGITRGDHVAVWATNWPRWVLLQFATARVGAVMVTINPAYRSSELAYVLRQSDAKALFLIDRFRTSDYFQLLRDAVPQLATVEPGADTLPALPECPRLQRIISLNEHSGPGICSWSAFAAGADAVSPEQLEAASRELTPADPINIQYTSGTTGFPKGAMLTHRNLLYNAYYIGDCMELSSQDRICVPVPFYHCFGCVLGTLCASVYGAALIIPHEHFDAEATLNAIEAERATAVYGVPTMFIGQLEHPTFGSRDLSSLRTGIMAGSPCPIEIMKRVVQEMHCSEITIAYGLTEASPVITQTRTDDPLSLRVETVGRPIPGIEVKLIDPETGQTLPDSQQGELCVRGHVVMRGYYNDAAGTAAAIDSEGWLHSGDLAVRQPDGYYRITGRIKDMICRGGENIYPREIEEFLFTHPAIEDVAVFGVPSVKFVEDVACWVRLREGASLDEEGLRAYCRDRMAHYKVPRYIRFVTSFPQTVTGKIQKFRMRETMVQELGLKAAETA